MAEMNQIILRNGHRFYKCHTCDKLFRTAQLRMSHETRNHFDTDPLFYDEKEEKEFYYGAKSHKPDDNTAMNNASIYQAGNEYLKVNQSYCKVKVNTKQRQFCFLCDASLDSNDLVNHVQKCHDAMEIENCWQKFRAFFIFMVKLHSEDKLESQSRNSSRRKPKNLKSKRTIKQSTAFHGKDSEHDKAVYKKNKSTFSEVQHVKSAPGKVSETESVVMLESGRIKNGSEDHCPSQNIQENAEKNAEYPHQSEGKHVEDVKNAAGTIGALSQTYQECNTEKKGSSNPSLDGIRVDANTEKKSDEASRRGVLSNAHVNMHEGHMHGFTDIQGFTIQDLKTSELLDMAQEKSGLERKTDSAENAQVEEGSSVWMKETAILDPSQLGIRKDPMYRYKRPKAREQLIGQMLDKKTILCDHCGKKFASPQSLKAHHQAISGTKYSCQICGKLFTRRSSLNSHAWVHIKEKNFTCETCGRAFKAEPVLKAHRKTHNSVGAYSCQICDKSFHNTSNYKRHMDIHYDIRRYTCHICLSSFRTSAHLKAHMPRHTGEKNYVCDICNMRFSYNASVKQHMRTHHNE